MPLGGGWPITIGIFATNVTKKNVETNLIELRYSTVFLPFAAFLIHGEVFTPDRLQYRWRSSKFEADID